MTRGRWGCLQDEGEMGVVRTGRLPPALPSPHPHPSRAIHALVADAQYSRQQLLLTDGDIKPPSEATLYFDGSCKGNHRGLCRQRAS